MKKLFNKIQEKLMSIGKDKHLHFECTTAISYFVSKLDQYVFGRDRYVAATIGAIAAFMVGFVKELCVDFLWRDESFDLNDIKANLVGSITGATMSLV